MTTSSAASTAAWARSRSPSASQAQASTVC
jgi:hypothetical protein